MPQVLVIANRSKFPALTDNYLTNLGLKLTHWIAEILTCDDPGGQLTPQDIEVHFQFRTHLDAGDEGNAITVTVFANYYPSRLGNLDDRCQRLQKILQDELNPLHMRGWVWVRLATASFKTF